jgi:hypothetical protein
MSLSIDVLPTLAVFGGSELSSWDVVKRTIVWLALTAVIAVVILTNKREHVTRVSLWRRTRCQCCCWGSVPSLRCCLPH